MKDFQQRKKIKKFLYSPLAVIILLILCGLLIRGTWNVYKKEKESRENLEKVTAEYERSKERQGVLEHQIERLSTEEGVEEEIREKFSVTKPGEEIVLVVEDDTSTYIQEDLKTSFWDKLKKIFGLN